VGVLASGRGSNLQAIIDAIERRELDARLAVVSSDREGAPALARARKHGAPAVFANPKDHVDRVEVRQDLVEL
jgi:phosphoribosylglycinamide formyltransferase-1